MQVQSGRETAIIQALFQDCHRKQGVIEKIARIYGLEGGKQLCNVAWSLQLQAEAGRIIEFSTGSFRGQDGSFLNDQPDAS
jgi:hypothetical protein